MKRKATFSFLFLLFPLMGMAQQTIGGMLEIRPSLNRVNIKGSFVYATATQTAIGPTDNVNVAGINVLFIDTSSNNVTIGERP